MIPSTAVLLLGGKDPPRGLQPCMTSTHAPHGTCPGGVAADLLFNWGRFSRQVWVVAGVFICGAMYTVLGFFPYMDNFGHFFGMFAGFLLTTCFLRTHEVG